MASKQAESIYIPRFADNEIEEHLDTFGAVAVVGPKWCGKTTTARKHSASEIGIADPKANFRNKQLAELEPNLVLQGEKPRLIDEWQEVPKLWDAVRFECDSNGSDGLFLLTGSSTPKKKAQPMHSGAGRIARVRMDTLTLQEQGVSSGVVSLSGLFSGASYSAISSLDLKGIAGLMVSGGWPRAMGRTARQAQLIAQNYLKAIIEEDISEVDEAKHNPVKVAKLIASLARNESTLAGKGTILADIGNEVSEPTVNVYIDALRRMFFVDDVPAWSPALRSPVRIRSSLKHHLVDPSLAAAALGASVDSLLSDPKTLGLLFESLAIHDLKVYARAIGASVFHYCDDSNLEVDIIIAKPNGQWGAFEVKLGSPQIDEGAKNVKALEKKMVERGERPASVKGVIVGVGSPAHMREDGVQIMPIDTIGI